MESIRVIIVESSGNRRVITGDIDGIIRRLTNISQMSSSEEKKREKKSSDLRLEK